MQGDENKKINFAFWGTPEVASETLTILKQAGFLPSLILTSPDKPRGRKMLVAPPPVKVWAEKNNIPYVQPEKNTELLYIFSSRGSHSEGEGRSGKKLEEAEYDLFIVVAYGKMMPENILKIPRLGSVNVHYSLLPKYRGASPVESAILNGETETGVTIQKMELKMDAGAIIAQEKTDIPPNEKAPELRKRLIKIGGELLKKMLKTPSASGHSPSREGERQDESQATYCGKIKKKDGLVDLATESPSALYNKFRAYAAWPRTFFIKNGNRIIITDAALEDGKFIVKKVLPEGKKEISWEVFQKQ